MAHDKHADREREAAWRAEQQEIEAVWMFLRDRGKSSTTPDDLLAGIVRVLRKRATVWEVQHQTVLAGECSSIADILEGRAGGEMKLPALQRPQR